MSSLRLGFIGWLSNPAEPGIKTVAWCDVNAQKLADCKVRHPDIHMYTDYREMLQKEALDAVFIASPNTHHAEQAIAFLDTGAHVFLEKPMGVNKAECDAVLQAAVRNNRLCVVDFEMRVSGFTGRIQKLIASGEYGALRRMEFIHHRGCWLEEGNGIWRTRTELSGGLYFMEPIHEVDIFRYLGGKILSVCSVAGPNVLPQYRFQDNVCSHFFFASGGVGTILTSHTHSAFSTESKDWTRDRGHGMDMILTFERGSVGADFIALSMTFNRFVDYPAGTGAFRVEFDHIENFSDQGPSAFGHDITRMNREFRRRLLAGEPPVVTTLDAWKSHQVCLAAEQSVREQGARVQVDFTLPPGIG